MAEFKLGEEQNYGNSSGSAFLSLKDDGDVKNVRFMYRDSNDVKGVCVHEVQINGKRRYVNCLRDYNSPIDDCPLCKNNFKQIVKVYVPLYDVAEQKVCFWERGKKYFSTLSGLCARYPNLVSHTFDIERHGAKGSKDTTYNVYETGADATTLESLPEIPEVIGGVVMSKTADEMNTYLQTGDFPYNSQPQPHHQSSPVPNVVPQRRTPVNTEVF
jgi:hypothetical protein